MPNHPVLVSGAVIVVAVAVGAAIAVYESPQARQFVEDARRKIALALHSLGDEINPGSQQPRFNRPEDAEGFLQSASEAGVDADEDSRRKQREELMYWNAVRMEKMEKEKKMNEKRPASNKSRSSSFEDFLQEDPNAEKGTFVYNTGTDLNSQAEEGLTHRRGVRGLDRSTIYANPFADEHGIDIEEQQATDRSLISPEDGEQYESDSEGLYSVHEGPTRPRSRQSTATLEAVEPLAHEDTETLVDISEPFIPDPPVSVPTYENMETEPTYTERSQDTQNPFASIHAWADHTDNSTGFYSPLPVTPHERPSTPTSTHISQMTPPSPTSSDPEYSSLESLDGDGMATPTDSASLAGSGEEVWHPRSGTTSEADVMSVDDGIITPDSWTEVGSLASEDAVHH
ncbi:6ed5b7ae-8756-4fa1-8780-1c636abe7333 [Sclerotinia trifoliorum]|uniref:6ed5b7ae-8756-4fa1-8780-1c636abe7333 n=1 Tax=Sclerotinia trifoliorum TaxID=28548 RepID=A0A8H2VZS1_9HELO|nr:6ed5b7ae-8756-4fa1-8780-1c636abe7333 [Sclerotinia trifoliorum]